MFIEQCNGLFIFYILIIVGFLPELLGCKLRDLLINNMFVKHVAAFLVLLTLVVFGEMDPKSTLSFGACVGYALLFYIWFLLTTRSSIYFMLLTFAALATIYLLHVYKLRMKTDDHVVKERINKIQEWIVYSAFGLTFLGFIIYTYAKYNEYASRGNYSFFKFLLGVRECRGDKFALLR